MKILLTLTIVPGKNIRYSRYGFTKSDPPHLLFLCASCGRYFQTTSTKHIIQDLYQERPQIQESTGMKQPIVSKVQSARKEFLHRICIVLQRFRALIYNVVANFFNHSGLTDLEGLTSYGFAQLYKYRSGYILDRA